MEEEKLSQEKIQTAPRPELKSKNWLPVGLGVLLLLSLATTGFLFSQNNQLKKKIALLEATPTLTPTPLPTVTPISSPTPTEPIPISPPATATPLTPTAVVKSSLCPVEFTVPKDRIYIEEKGKYGTWQLKDRPSERFFYLPRAEEVNGREAEMELRAEGQIYGNGEALISVHCQDNHNHWHLEDFMDYVVKADFLVDPVTTKTNLWGRDVYILTHSGVPSETVWLFATPDTLFHVRKIIPNESFQDQAEEIFDTLQFE